MEGPDCGDNSCFYALDRRGMRTNGGCRCDRAEGMQVHSKQARPGWYYTRKAIRLGHMAVRAHKERIAALQRENEDLQAMAACETCGGKESEGCVCGGSGMSHDAARHLRTRLTEAEKREATRRAAVLLAVYHVSSAGFDNWETEAIIDILEALKLNAIQ